MGICIGNFDNSVLPADVLAAIGEDVPMYGVKFDPTGKTSVGVRTYDAATLKFTPSTASTAGIDDFATLAPFKTRECCRVYSNGSAKYYYKDNYSASDWQDIREGKNSTINGDIMIEIPAFYYYRPSAGEFIVSEKFKTGFLPSPAHYRNGKMLNKIWICKYNIDTNYESKSKTTPRVSTNMNTFRSNLIAKDMYVIDYPTWCSVAMLLLVKYGTLDVQSVINGRSTSSVLANGNADNVLGLDGSATNVVASESCLCLGIENFYGNAWKFLDGMFLYQYYVYLGDITTISADPKSYNDLSTYTKLTNKIHTSNASVTNLCYDKLFPYCMYNVSGSESYLTNDYQYTGGGFQCALFGGSFLNGSSDGLFGANFSGGVGDSGSDIGCCGCSFS